MDFKEELRKLKIYYDVFSNKELAEKLNLSKQAVDDWARRKTIPKRYLEKIENSKINTNSGTVQINGNNHGHININSSDEMSMEICKCIKRLSEKRKEYYYHLIKADLLKEEIE